MTAPPPPPIFPLVNFTSNGDIPLCFDLRIIDARPHHPCYSWNHSVIQCEIDWPCEVRQYLLSLSPLVHLCLFLLSWGTGLVILLGVLLNSLSIYILFTSPLLRSGSGIYLISLALCDLLNLLLNYLPGLLRAHLPTFNDLFLTSEWACRWHGVFVEVFQLISAWIVVSFTVERCLAIWYPLLVRNLSRTRRAVQVVTTLSFILMLFSLTKLALTGFEKDSVFGYPACFSHRFRWQGVAYVRVAAQTWLPTILVFTFNLLMFGKLRQIKKKRKTLTGGGNGGRGRVPPKPGSVRSRQGSFLSRPNATAPMLVAVSLAYLVLVFPLGVVQTVELIWSVWNPQPTYTWGDMVARGEFIRWKNTKILLKYVRSLCFGFYQINFCVNFFLYFAAGLQFRMHLLRKMEGWWRWCGGEGGGGNWGHEPVTPGTSSSALEQSSRRESQRQRQLQQQQRISRTPPTGEGGVVEQLVNNVNNNVIHVEMVEEEEESSEVGLGNYPMKPLVKGGSARTEIV